MTKENKPEMRFSGFNEDWKQRKLGDILKLLKDGTHGSHKDVTNGHYLLSAKNIKDGRIFWDKTDRIISDEDYKKIHSTFKINKGDVLLTIVGSIGETAIFNVSEEITFQRSVAILRPIDEVSSDFLYSEITSPKFQKFLNLNKSTSAQPGIYLGDLANISFSFPENKEEQKMIGRLFTDLNSTITLQQRKLELLKNQKKAFLEKMFPKEGENVPEIRFSGFSDAWKQRKFGDFAKVSMCKRVFKEETTQTGDVPFFKIGTFGGIPDAFISRYKFESYKAKYPYPKKGDILISASGSIGRIVEYSGKDEYFQDSNIIWLDHDESVLNSFLKHVYSIIKWNGIEGTTIKRLYNDNVLTTKILTPSLEEQSKIGIFFTQLDNTITLQQRKLEILKNIKKSFLQKMFV